MVDRCRPILPQMFTGSKFSTACPSSRQYRSVSIVAQRSDWPADLEIFDERLRVALRQARYSLSPWPSSLSLDAYWMQRSHLYWETRSRGLTQNCPIPALEPTPSWLMFGVFVTRLILVTLSDSVSRDGRLIKQESKLVFLISVLQRNDY